MAFDTKYAFVGFCVGFTRSPRNDFGTFAQGYHRAAHLLSQALLAKPRFPDYEAYPVAYLYRHAFELNLKNVIYKAALLSAFRRMDDFDAKLYNQHKLQPLASRAREILIALFPEDQGLTSIADDLRVVAQEMSTIDDSSYVYRYPIARDGRCSVDRPQTVNLVGLSTRMDQILNQPEVIDFGIDVETHVAQEVFEIIERLTTEDHHGQ